MKLNKKKHEINKNDLNNEETVDECLVDGEYVPEGKCISKFTFNNN